MTGYCNLCGETICVCTDEPIVTNAMVQRDMHDEITTLKSALREAKAALEDAESCMQGVIEGDYKPDSFTTQPYRLAIATINTVLKDE